MTKLERVITGLTIHNQYQQCATRSTRSTLCPYFSDDECVRSILRDALELLKEQEPRVLTLDEIKDYDKPIWVDEKGWGSWKLPFYAFDLDLYAIFGRECFLIGDYGKEWLPWTSQPTDEQRKAVKWE